uniref:HMG box domain-containing protein n=1 Tax=Laticauda laticaudata TaxID=8630 RepID=A0A8C5SEF8_LATLA
NHGAKRKGLGKTRKQRGQKRRPQSAFFLFMKDRRSKLKCDNPNWNVIQMAKRLGTMWHQQPHNDKENYKRKAAQLWQSYSKSKGCRTKRKRKKRKLGRRRCQNPKNRKRKAVQKKTKHCKCDELERVLKSLFC